MESKNYVLSLSTVFFVVILFSNIIEATPAISSTDEKYVLNIESCKCLPITRHCEVSISSKVWPHLKCQEDHQYCCQLAKKPTNSSNVIKTTITGRNTNGTKPKAPEINPNKNTNNNNNYNNTRNVTNLKTRISPPRIKYMSLTKERTTTSSGNNMKNNNQTSSVNRKAINSASNPLSSHQRSAPSSPLSLEARKNVSSNKNKVKISCSCQLRENCPKNFTDNRFNACPNGRVKCCTPVSPPQQLIAAPNTKNINPDSSSSASCFCLPKSKCKLTTELSRMNTMAKLRSDSVCPLNLIQCCGNNIVIAADDRSDQVEDTQEEQGYDEDDRVDDYEEDGHNGNANDNHRKDNINKENVQEKIVVGRNDLLLTPTIGTGSKSQTQSSMIQPQFKGTITEQQRQPIQLPQLRVPLNPMPPSPSEELKTSTIPPPQLPTQYYYTPPNQHYKHLYTQQQQNQNYEEQQQQKPNNYYFTSKNSSPWVSNGFSDRSGYDNTNTNTNMNVYGRGLSESRSSGSGSFFNSLALLFG